jgi:ferredoxin
MTPAMHPCHITLDGRTIPVRLGQTILEVARQSGLDIPTLCFLEKCGPLNTCQVCLVKVDGRLMPSCGTHVRPGMEVESETPEVHEARRTALELLFSDHVGDCLAPCQRLCPLGLNIPLLLRQVDGDAATDAGRTVRASLPLAGALGRLCHHPCEQGCRRGHWDEPAAIRDIERFATDHEAFDSQATPPLCKPSSGKKVAIIGAGPAGLAAAYCLAQNGHHATVFDRNAKPGGTLRNVPETELPPVVLDREIALLERMGTRFVPNTECGQKTIEELRGQFDALLLATGETTEAEAIKMGLETCGSPPAPAPALNLNPVFLKADPNTFRTALPNVYAAGAAIRAVRQLVRAIAEGKSAAESVCRFLNGETTSRPERPFSSVMGRLQPEELKRFLPGANTVSSVNPCDRCAGLSRTEAPLEASRCLHCDCRASGNCALQHYAQVYKADANRFRSERKLFERQIQPGGIVFEPGKCILCGICVKLTELAAEPLGLTFVGRGFTVRLAAPLNHELEEGLKKTATECVEHCPTGALAFRIR